MAVLVRTTPHAPRSPDPGRAVAATRLRGAKHYWVRYRPATALAAKLRRGHWTLSPDGCLRGPGHWLIQVRYDTPGSMAQAIGAAWRATLPALVRHRNGLQALGVPCADTTARALSRFKPGEQFLIALSITGGFLSPAAKMSWDPLQDSSCALCGACCTKRHQLLECPATQTLRDSFAEPLQRVHGEAAHWVHACVATEHPAEPFLRLVWDTRALVPPPDLRPAVQQHQLSTLSLYTDGTCFAPDVPPASHAAWAVTLDLQPHEAPHRLRAHWKQHRAAPCDYVVVAQGLVPRSQTVYRAEICALVQAVHIALQFPELSVSIGVDSSSALEVVRAALQGHLPARAQHGDLLALLPSAAPNVFLYKVKSHQDPMAVPLDRLRAVMGNHCADRAADSARRNDLDNIRADAAEVALWRKTQEQHLHGYFRYLTCLAKEVVPQKMQQQAHDRRQLGADNQFLATRWLALTQMGYPVPGLGDLPVAGLLDLLWPPWFTASLWDWASQLGWAPHSPTVERHRGATYLELMFNYVATERVLPPKLVGKAGKGHYLDLLQGEGRMVPFSVQELILTFVGALKALTKVGRTPVLKSKAHHRILSLSFFPAEQHGRKGILDRPAMPALQDTYELLSAYLEAKEAECLRHFCVGRSPPKAADEELQRRWASADQCRRRRALGRGV